MSPWVWDRSGDRFSVQFTNNARIPPKSRSAGAVETAVWVVMTDIVPFGTGQRAGTADPIG